MKPEEALKYLKDFIDNEEPQIGAYNTEVLKKAIYALEKHVPKKPILFSSEHIYLCPNCHRTDYIKRRDALDAYCGFCGQSIDWEEWEE